MQVTRVSRAMIRAIKPMDMEVFFLPTVNACYVARAQVAHVHNTDGYTLKCHIDMKEKKVVIKRLA